jgi:hypothetical protein
MTIVDAAAAVLRETSRPMTAPEIYAEIAAKRLYDFKAKRPLQVLLQQLRRHSVGFDTATSSKTKVFARQGEDQFVLLPDSGERR